jgi:hypothetical protein
VEERRPEAGLPTNWWVAIRSKVSWVSLTWLRAINSLAGVRLRMEESSALRDEAISPVVSVWRIGMSPDVEKSPASTLA